MTLEKKSIIWFQKRAAYYSSRARCLLEIAGNDLKWNEALVIMDYQRDAKEFYRMARQQFELSGL